MFVIYHKDTTKQHSVRTQHVRCYRDEWATESAAKAARTRSQLDKDVWLIAEIMDFRDNIELKEERTNAMSGKKFTSSVNAPYSTCPSSENYWSS